MLSIVGRAFRLLARRWPLYFIAASVTIALESGIVELWRVPQSLEFANDAITPILVTLVYAFTAADALEQNEPNTSIWARVLERAWAVILIDFVVTIFFEGGLGLLSSGSVLGPLIGTLLLLITATLLFADLIATIDDRIGHIFLIPRAILRSIVIALHPRTILNVMILFSAQLIVGYMFNELYRGLRIEHVPHPLLWSILPLNALTAVVFAAITLAFYLAISTSRSFPMM